MLLQLLLYLYNALAMPVPFQPVILASSTPFLYPVTPTILHMDTQADDIVIIFYSCYNIYNKYYHYLLIQLFAAKPNKPSLYYINVKKPSVL